MKFSLCCASIQSFQLYFYYLNMIRLCKASGPSGPTCDLWRYSQQSSALPSEIILLVAHGFLLGFYKLNFLLVPFIQTMRVTCQSDGTWTGRLFLLHWTESHVDKSLQKGKVAAVLLRCSEPWKDNTNKFEHNSMVPHTITEDATCSS